MKPKGESVPTSRLSSDLYPFDTGGRLFPHFFQDGCVEGNTAGDIYSAVAVLILLAPSSTARSAGDELDRVAQKFRQEFLLTQSFAQSIINDAVTKIALSRAQNLILQTCAKLREQLPPARRSEVHARLQSWLRLTDAEQEGLDFYLDYIEAQLELLPALHRVSPPGKREAISTVGA